MDAYNMLKRGYIYRTICGSVSRGDYDFAEKGNVFRTLVGCVDFFDVMGRAT